LLSAVVACGFTAQSISPRWQQHCLLWWSISYQWGI